MLKTPLPASFAQLKRYVEMVRGYLVRREERQVSVILLSTPILLTLWVYQGKGNSFARLFATFRGTWPADVYATLFEFFAAFLLMFGVPALLARFGLGMRLYDLGVRLGDWRAGLRIVVALLPLALLTAYLAAGNPAIRATYPLAKSAIAYLALFVLVEACYLVYYLGWEFFFRGFVLFGLERPYGALAAILIQTIPSTLVHIGKPLSENLAATVAGLLLGYVAWRTRSIFYSMLLHAVVGIGTDLFIALRTP